MTQEGKSGLKEVLGRLEIRRSLYLLYAVIFISYAFLSWFSVGYLLLPVIVMDWFLLVIGALLAIFSVYLEEEPKVVRYLPYAGFVVSFLIFGELLSFVLPAYATDELASNTYAAYQFIHGLDPYINSNMAGVFSYSHLSPYSITPLTTGGAVDFLVYPGLSVLLFIPAVLLGIRSYEIIVFFAILSFFLLAYYYKKRGIEETLPFLVVAMVISGQYAYYSLTGDDDIIWVFFLALAYIYRKNPLLSGIFFGLSLSFKQIAALVLPFFLYFIYRENGRKARSGIDFIVGGIASFLVTNAPFIWMEPVQWFRHIISVDTQPILGAGIGPSVLAFAGYLNISSNVFLTLLVVTFLIFFILYLTYYNELKYAFFAFPMFIFIFNFRVLENYLAFWPFLILMVMPDFLEEFRARKTMGSHHHPHVISDIRFSIATQKKVAAAFIAVIIGSGGFIIYDVSSVSSPVHITGVWNASDPLWTPGYISHLQVNLTYTPSYGDPGSLDLNFRILPMATPLSLNPNALLWHTDKQIFPGASSVNIFPNTYADLLPNNVTFTIQVYYSSFVSSFSSDKLSIPTDFPISNPNMSLPSYLSNSSSSHINPVYPGWNYSLVSGVGNGSFKYSILPVGFNLSLDNKKASRQWAIASVSSAINVSRLAAGGYTLKYSLTNLRGNPYYYSFYSKNSSLIVGAQISFYGGKDNLTIGFNPGISSDIITYVNDTNLIVISNSSELSFANISNLLNTNGWSIQEATLSYVLMTYGVSGLFYATFYSFSLVSPAWNSSSGFSRN